MWKLYYVDMIEQPRTNETRKTRVENITKEILNEVHSIQRHMKEEAGIEKEGRAKLDKEFARLLNSLTGGMFLEHGTIQHIINAYGYPVKPAYNFNPEDKIDIERLSRNGLYFSTSSTEFPDAVPGSSLFPDAKIILLASPRNTLLRRFYKRFVDEDYGPLNSWQRDFLENKSVSFPYTETTFRTSNTKRITNRPARLPKWSQVVDCIVDLEKGTVTFYGSIEK